MLPLCNSVKDRILVSARNLCYTAHYGYIPSKYLFIYLMIIRNFAQQTGSKYLKKIL